MDKHPSCQRGGQAGRYSPVTFPGDLLRRPSVAGVHHADLRDSPAVHCSDLEPIALDLDRVANGRKPSKTPEDEPTHRVVWLVRELDTQALAECVERGEPIHHERSRALLLEGGRLTVEFV